MWIRGRIPLLLLKVHLETSMSVSASKEKCSVLRFLLYVGAYLLPNGNKLI